MLSASLMHCQDEAAIKQERVFLTFQMKVCELKANGSRVCTWFGFEARDVGRIFVTAEEGDGGSNKVVLLGSKQLTSRSETETLVGRYKTCLLDLIDQLHRNAKDGRISLVLDAPRFLFSFRQGEFQLRAEFDPARTLESCSDAATSLECVHYYILNEVTPKVIADGRVRPSGSAVGVKMK